MDGVEGLDGIPLPLLIRSDSSAFPLPLTPPETTLSGTAGTPFRVAIPLGFNPEVIISDCTLLGGGGVFCPGILGLPFPRPICINPGDTDLIDWAFEVELELGFEMDLDEEPSSEPFPVPFHGK